MFVARLNNLKLAEKSKKLELKGFETANGKFAPKSRNLSRSNWITIPQTTSSELMEFIGLIVSEGYVSEDGITFANNDKCLRERYKILLKKLFKIEKSKEYRDGRVVVYSKTLVAFLKLFKMMPGKKQLSIPPLFYTLPKQVIAAFIQVYFHAYGCVTITNKNSNVRYMMRGFNISRKFTNAVAYCGESPRVNASSGIDFIFDLQLLQVFHNGLSV